jgi:hypothetical protein
MSNEAVANENTALEKKRNLVRQITLGVILAVVIVGCFGVGIKASRDSTTNASLVYEEQINNLLYDLEVLVNDDEISDADKVSELKDFIDRYQNEETASTES